jgi:hypothetical protein
MDNKTFWTICNKAMVFHNEFYLLNLPACTKICDFLAIPYEGFDILCEYFLWQDLSVSVKTYNFNTGLWLTI